MTTPASDWREFALGDILSFSNGINADKSAYGAGVPFANVLEVIKNESITETDIPGRIAIDPKVARRYEVKPGDVLFNRTSETQEEVGLASVYVGNERVVFGGFVFRGRPMTDELSTSYAKYAFRSPIVRNQIVARGQGGIRANIGQRDLKSVVVRLPSCSEQSAIAEVLDDVSSFISTLERMIAKKQAIKQGMMQQLLTGKTRLPGFTTSWSELNAGSVGAFKGGSGFPVRYQGESSGTYPFYKVSDMNNRGNERLMQRANNYISETQRKQIGAVLIPKNAIVFAKVGAAIFQERKRMLTQPSCIDNNMAAFVLDDSLVDVRFVQYALTKFMMGSLVATTALPSLNSGQLRSIPLLIPPTVDEQRTIAAVLHDVDNEVDFLNHRLSKTRAVKQGMMQELLTGRTRLPIQEGAA